MKTNIVSHAGWLIAAALGTLMLAGGFQDGAAKFGVVDMSKIMNDSADGKKLKDELQTQFNVRQGLLEFIAANPTITPEQATKLRDLSIKPNATAADKAEIENIKKQVVADTKRFESLGQKATLSEAERADLEDLGARRRNAGNLVSRWQQEFSQEISNVETDRQGALVDKVKVAVNSVAKKQGYTVVFQSNVAVYGANDLTAEAIKAVDAGS